MEALTTLTAVAAPLNMMNVDTDMIIPKDYLKTITRTGLGKGLFAELRYDNQGKENPLFVLNQAPYRNARILVSGKNFGCGSSREHAPWALHDCGFRCIIAPSFADIFFINIFKNGMLPVTLSEARVDELMRLLLELPGAEIAVDLESQTVTGPDGQVDIFSIEEFQKHCLLNGIDEVGMTMAREAAIADFERKDAVKRNWLSPATRAA